MLSKCNENISAVSKVSVDERRSIANIGVNSYWAQGLKPPPTFMIMGLAYMTSPPPHL